MPESALSFEARFINDDYNALHGRYFFELTVGLGTVEEYHGWGGVETRITFHDAPDGPITYYDRYIGHADIGDDGEMLSAVMSAIRILQFVRLLPQPAWRPALAMVSTTPEPTSHLLAA